MNCIEYSIDQFWTVIVWTPGNFYAFFLKGKFIQRLLQPWARWEWESDSYWLKPTRTYTYFSSRSSSTLLGSPQQTFNRMTCPTLAITFFPIHISNLKSYSIMCSNMQKVMPLYCFCLANHNNINIIYPLLHLGLPQSISGCFQLWI